MAEIDAPRYFSDEKTINLVMSTAYFKANPHKIEELLEFYGFVSEIDVTRIDDEYNNIVHFIQSTNGEDNLESFITHSQGCGEITHH